MHCALLDDLPLPDIHKIADTHLLIDNAADAPCSLFHGTATLGSLKLTHNEVHGEVLILSVDDEPTNHMVLEEAMRSQGHRMHQVSSHS